MTTSYCQPHTTEPRISTYAEMASQLVHIQLLVQRGKHPKCSALIARLHTPAVAQSRPPGASASVALNGILGA